MRKERGVDVSTQPEALRLADAIDGFSVTESAAADELRRLHEVNQELLKALKEIANIPDLEWGTDWEEIEQARGIARAAILKATGEQA